MERCVCNNTVHSSKFKWDDGKYRYIARCSRCLRETRPCKLKKEAVKEWREGKTTINEQLKNIGRATNRNS